MDFPLAHRLPPSDNESKQLGYELNEQTNTKQSKNVSANEGQFYPKICGTSVYGGVTLFHRLEPIDNRDL